MKNPFFIGEYLRLEASINKVMLINIEKLIKDKKIEGKSAFDVFSTEQIIEEIKKHSDKLKLNIQEIPEKELPVHLNRCLESIEKEVKETAKIIIEKYGKRLGVILYILKRGKSDNELERKDWNDEDWAYWQSIENIVLTGGLSSGEMGKYLKKNIEHIFREANISPYNILLTKNPSNAGLMGASMYVKEKNGSNLIFDFGQSFLKRSIVSFENNVLVSIKTLEKVQSKYMEWNPDLTIKFEKESKLLDEYLQETIINSYIESKENKIEIGAEIIISVANYIMNGNFLNRGGYGKLGLISDNYEEHLSNEISKKTGKNFKIKIVHDGTAISANFMDIKNVASISLGTAFGIGFPKENKYGKEIQKEIHILQIKY